MVDDLFKHNLDLKGSFWNTARDSLLIKWIDKGPVLDVGCGAGIMTRQLIAKDYTTYSLDSEKRAVDYVKKFNENTFHEDITEIDTSKYPKFNTVIMLDVLEHVREDEKALENAHQLLNDGGLLIISVPYHTLLWNKTDKHHYRRYSRTQLKNILSQAGFSVKELRFWNMLSLIPLFISKLLAFELSHRRIAYSRLNKVLTTYFLNIENRIPVPVGSQLFCKAVKKE